MDQISLNIERQIRNAIAADKKCKFISIVKGQLEKEKPEISNSKLCPSELLVWICCYRAVDCATALLEGETGQTVDLNVPLECELFPLHHAAQFLSSGLTQLFLRHGARTDLRCDGFLPLHVAIETLSYHIDWTPQQSLFKLVIILCLPQLYGPLKTIELLAKKTEGVQELMHHYAVGGKVIELAALLMAVGEKIMYPLIHGSANSSTLYGINVLCHCVSNEISLLVEEEGRLMGKCSSKLAGMLRDKKTALMSVKLFLEVFVKAGSTLQLYMQCSIYYTTPKHDVVKEVSGILKKLGSVLNEKDTDLSDMECFSNPLILAQLGKPRDSRAQPKDLCLELSSFKPGFFTAKQNPITSMPRAQAGIHLSCLPQFEPKLFLGMCPFHAFQILRANFSSKSHTTMETHIKKTTKVVGQYVSNSSSSKKWASYALAIKRGIRHV